MQIDWLDIFNKVLEVAVFPILTAVAMYVVTLIKTKKQEILENVKNETAKKYLELLDSTVTDCVKATNQTYVETLKAQGIFDAEAQRQAFQITYEKVMAILSDDAVNYLTAAVKDLEAYITNKIEAQVANTN